MHAECLLGAELVVGSTEAAEVFRSIGAAEGAGVDVVELYADAAVAGFFGDGVDVLAAGLVALEDLAADLGGDAIGGAMRNRSGSALQHFSTRVLALPEVLENVGRDCR